MIEERDSYEKVFIYIVLDGKNLAGQWKRKEKKMASFFYVLLTDVFLPVLITVILFPFLNANRWLILFLPVFILLLDLDQSVQRVKFPPDMKQMFLLKFTFLQYILAKDFCKFYHQLIFIMTFVLAFYIQALLADFQLLLFMALYIGLFFVFIGYCLRFVVLIFLVKIKNLYMLGLFNYMLPAVPGSVLYINYDFRIFSAFMQRFGFNVYTVWAGILLVICFLFYFVYVRRHRGLSLQVLYDRAVPGLKKRKRDSIITNSLLRYELLQLFRNPPVRVSAILFLFGVTYAFYGYLIYYIDLNPELFRDFSPVIFYVLMIVPILLGTFLIQSFVSFDLEGRIIPLKRIHEKFIINKISVKIKISLICHLVLFFLNAIAALFFLEDIFSMKAFFITLLTYIYFSSCAVTSTILFPYFNWNFVYEVPSRRSQLTNLIMISAATIPGSYALQKTFIS